MQGIASRSEETSADVAAALCRLSAAELVKLKALARLRAQGLPRGVGWTDLLHEAVARSLEGSRRLPPNVQIVAFLGGVMRSIASEHWRRARTEAGVLADLDDSSAFAAGDPPKDPERTALAIQALSSIHGLFARDPDVLKVLSGLADELTGEEIRQMYGLSAQAYEAARKRLRRAALRWLQGNDAP